MMDQMETLVKALADDTRLNIVKLLLSHNHCVRSLAKSLGLSESAISQHIKVLRECGLLYGEKHGYFMHYDVDRDRLRELGAEFAAMADIEREQCAHHDGDAGHEDNGCGCHSGDTCGGHEEGECKCTEDGHKPSRGADDEKEGCCGHKGCGCHGGGE